MPKKVLVADDSPTIRKIVELCLTDQEIEVRGSSSGAEAVELYRSWSPDIVLADVVMPGPDGYELCDRIKDGALGRVVPVILLADLFIPFDEERALETRADGHIAKPFEPSTLLAVMADHFGALAAASASREDDDDELLLEPEMETASAADRPRLAPLAGDLFGSAADSEDIGMSPDQLDAVARRVVRLISEDVVREVAWEVIPEMSEVLLREKMQNR